MKVLHALPTLSPRLGGPAMVVVNAARALRPLGWESTIVATDLAHPASWSGRERVTLADIPNGAGLDARLYPARWPYRLAYSPALARALRELVHEYDVVHIHMLFQYPQFAAYEAARRAGVPYVVAPRGALDPHLRRRSRLVKAVTGLLWQRRMLDAAAALHFTTGEEARLVSDLRLRSVPCRVLFSGRGEVSRLPVGQGFHY